MYPRPGDVLAGRYRVGSVIGRGGMGLVLEAQNVVTEKRVAIKWLLADPVSSAEAGERLLREATAASRIRHPNVVDVYDVLQDGEAVFLVMDLLRGEPLDALLRRGGMPMHQLIGLLLPAMEGVAEAHRLEIIHRDIHPGNIFVAQEGADGRLVPKVLDFGISKLGGSEQRRLTRSNISMGTPVYMSYEQLYSARDVDQRTDVYSFGVILYQVLTGRRPYDGESFVEVAGKITAGNPVHPKLLRPELPGPLAELALWAMAKQREDRIDSIEQLMAELAPFAVERTFRAEMSGERPLPLVPPLHSSSSLPLDVLRPPVPETPSARMPVGVTPRSAPPPLQAPGAPKHDPKKEARRRPRGGILAGTAAGLAVLAVFALTLGGWQAQAPDENVPIASPAPPAQDVAPAVVAPFVAPPAPAPEPTPKPTPPPPAPGPMPPRPRPKPWVRDAGAPKGEHCVDGHERRPARAGAMRCVDLY